METKKMISARELVDRIKAQRKRAISPEFVERFNRITEMDEKHDIDERAEIEKSEQKIARAPETPL